MDQSTQRQFRINPPRTSVVNTEKALAPTFSNAPMVVVAIPSPTPFKASKLTSVV